LFQPRAIDEEAFEEIPAFVRRLDALSALPDSAFLTSFGDDPVDEFEPAGIG
jgi:hypothetical protein